MVIRELLQHAAAELSGSDSPLLDAKLLLESVLSKDRVYLTVHRDEPVSEDDRSIFEALVSRRKRGEPIAYILKYKEFMGLPFFVNPSVLIPRPDTETLVEYAINHATGKVLDIGTGSGCIAISLKKYRSDLDVTALDKSSEALDVAKRNAEKNNTLISFICADILKNDINGTFDTVVSNPPYIDTNVIPTLSLDVRGYEPHMALDGGTDGLIFYREITKKACHLLSCNGLLIFEVGYNQSNDVAGIMSAYGFKDIEMICDLSGIARVVAGRMK